jgi:hypothetical protein
LKEDGHCLIQENYLGSREDDFLPMLEGSGLVYAGSFMSKAEFRLSLPTGEFPSINPFYFFWTRADVPRADVPRADVPELIWQDSAPTTIDATRSSLTEQAAKLEQNRKYVLTLRNDGSDALWLQVRDGRGAGVFLEVVPRGKILRCEGFVPFGACSFYDARSGRELLTVA